MDLVEFLTDYVKERGVAVMIVNMKNEMEHGEKYTRVIGELKSSVSHGIHAGDDESSIMSRTPGGFRVAHYIFTRYSVLEMFSCLHVRSTYLHGGIIHSTRRTDLLEMSRLDLSPRVISINYDILESATGAGLLLTYDDI
jgi:hypothetical protein